MPNRRRSCRVLVVLSLGLVAVAAGGCDELSVISITQDSFGPAPTPTVPETTPAVEEESLEQPAAPVLR